MRIVSLLPSATEIVCGLGLGDQLVGVTHECDFPAFVRELPVVTHTLVPHEATSREIDELVSGQLATRSALYRLDEALLRSLAPDLIVTQALCDVCAVPEDEARAVACALPAAPAIVNLEPLTLAHVLEDIVRVGVAAGREAPARALVAALRARVQTVAERTARVARRPRVVLLEWIDPLFSCGHWSPELVALAGGIEGMGRTGERSRRMRWEEIIAWQPEVLCIACCGFDLARTEVDLPVLASRPGFDQLPCVRTGQVWLFNGSDYFSRPGPRLVEGLEMLAHVLHPDLHPPVEGVVAPVRLIN